MIFRSAIVITLIGLCWWTAVAASSKEPDRFVQMLERRLSGEAHIQITPGVTVTLVDCNCTVRYVGTTVRGNHYDIRLDKLD